MTNKEATLGFDYSVEADGWLGHLFSMVCFDTLAPREPFARSLAGG